MRPNFGWIRTTGRQLRLPIVLNQSITSKNRNIVIDQLSSHHRHKTMAEHTPAPTPNRAVYGFAWFLFFKTLFVLYVFWAFVPDHILIDTLGLTYLPEKYFALYIPIFVLCCLTIFAFLIYPPSNLAMQDDIDDTHTIRDQYTIRRCTYICAKTKKKCEEKITRKSSSDNNIWHNVTFCDIHRMQTEGESTAPVTSYCDCVDKTKCLLTKNPKHLNTLAERATVPTVYDLDLADVCTQIFRQRNKRKWVSNHRRLTSAA